jgi:hypothetical protein
MPLTRQQIREAEIKGRADAYITHLRARLPHVVSFEIGEAPDASFFQIRITKARLVHDRVLELAIAIREDGAPWKRVWRDGHPAEAITTWRATAPSVHVPDPTGNILRPKLDEDGNPTGTFNRYRFAPGKALKAQLMNLIIENNARPKSGPKPETRQ